jgi:hypothetical protein
MDKIMSYMTKPYIPVESIEDESLLCLNIMKSTNLEEHMMKYVVVKI